LTFSSLIFICRTVRGDRNRTLVEKILWMSCSKFMQLTHHHGRTQWGPEKGKLSISKSFKKKINASRKCNDVWQIQNCTNEVQETIGSNLEMQQETCRIIVICKSKFVCEYGQGQILDLRNQNLSRLLKLELLLPWWTF
jgi:hypothetical protein